MPSAWCARMKLLTAVDKDTFYTIDDVETGTAFDVLANVEIGKDFNENVDRYDLWVTIKNLSKSTTVASVHKEDSLIPKDEPFFDQVRVPIPAGVDGWDEDAAGVSKVDSGDILQAIASYKVTAGANAAYSTEQSDTFVVA